MKSIHTNKRGKYPIAIYDCTVYAIVDEDWITHLWPRRYGHSVTAYGYTLAVGTTRWHMLIANTKQTTVADIKTRIDKYMPTDQPFNYDVQLVASLTDIGFNPHTGSPRSGTKRVRLNSAHGNIVAAR